MKFRIASLAASLLLLSFSAQAHDPSLHEEDRMPVAKDKPTTCAELADTQRYSNDLAEPDIKALKTKCDAAKKAANKASAKKAK
jgi:hypothetical protein